MWSQVGSDKVRSEFQARGGGLGAPARKSEDLRAWLPNGVELIQISETADRSRIGTWEEKDDSLGAQVLPVNMDILSFLRSFCSIVLAPKQGAFRATGRPP